MREIPKTFKPHAAIHLKSVKIEAYHAPGLGVKTFTQDISSHPAWISMYETDGWVALGEVFESEGMHGRCVIDHIYDCVVALQTLVVGRDLAFVATG